MSNLVNVVKTVLGSKFDVRSFEAKNRVFEFDHQQMNMFEFVRCSKNDVRVRSMFDKMVFDPSLEKTENCVPNWHFTRGCRGNLRLYHKGLRLFLISSTFVLIHNIFLLT